MQLYCYYYYYYTHYDYIVASVCTQFYMADTEKEEEEDNEEREKNLCRRPYQLISSVLAALHFFSPSPASLAPFPSLWPQPFSP